MSDFCKDLWHFIYEFPNLCYSEAFSLNGALKETLMVEDRAPARRRRLGAHGKMFRRRRIFAQLREGFTYEEIANEA